MPGLGGFDLYERLRASGRSVPVVFITGHGDDTLAAKAMQAGAVAFLAKPFGETALLEAVARAVARSRDAGILAQAIRSKSPGFHDPSNAAPSGP
jgi:FixJ family two-component response regulator